MKQKKLIFNFFVNRNWKKLTDSRKRTKILADNRKNHQPIETLFLVFVTDKDDKLWVPSHKPDTCKNSVVEVEVPGLVVYLDFILT